jgi:hypothetical protein
MWEMEANCCQLSPTERIQCRGEQATRIACVFGLWSGHAFCLHFFSLFESAEIVLDEKICLKFANSDVAGENRMFSCNIFILKSF